MVEIILSEATKSTNFSPPISMLWTSHTTSTGISNNIKVIYPVARKISNSYCSRTLFKRAGVSVSWRVSENIIELTKRN